MFREFQYMQNISPEKNRLQRSKSQMSVQEIQSDLKYTGKVELPANFAEELLNNEMDLEQDKIEVGVVNNLIQLYMLAIEYYESQNSDRYIIFQNKMKSLWGRPNVIEAMSRSNKDSKVTPYFQNLKIQQKKRDMEIKLIYSNEHQAKEIVESQTLSIQKNSQIIQSDIDNQRDNIMKRLMERKSRSKTPTKKRNATPDFTSSTEQKIPLQDVSPNRIFQSDQKLKSSELTQKSFGMTSIQDLQKLAFKKKSDKLKEQRIQEIENNYNTQLDILINKKKQNQKNSLIDKVIEKVKNEKQAKILQINQQFEKKLQLQLHKIE